MKKVKYLLGIGLLGLLFSVSNADTNFQIQLVNTQFPTTFVNADYSISYSYLFQHNFDGSCRTDGSQRYYDGYSVSNGGSSLLIDKLYKAGSYSSVCFANTTIFNKSYYGFDYYTGTCSDIGRYPSSLYANLNIFGLGSSQCPRPYSHKVLLGKNSNFGQVFSFMNFGNYTPTSFPVYGFGNNYFTGNDWLEVLSSNMNNGLRLFYNSASGQNDLYNRDYVDLTYNANTPIFAWEYFTNQQTLTNFGYVVDTVGRKGKHFGSMGIGYSFVYNKDASQKGNKVSWNTLGFATVSDDIITNLRSFGGLDLVNFDGTASFYTDGILILRKNQYTNNGNDGVIVISKNPNNVKELLFQEFSCQTNNFQCIARGQSTGSDGVLTNYCPSYIIENQSSSYNPCLVLSQGLLARNGSTNVLPFTSRNGLVNTSGNDLLKYLFDSGTGLNSTSLGYTYVNGDSFCIGSGICFEKVQSANSIKENYLDGKYENPYEYVTESQVENGTYELCTTNAYFASVNYELCHGLNPSDIVSVSGSDYVITYVDYGSGNIVQKLIPRPDYEDGGGTDSDGNSYIVCSSSHPCTSNNEGSPYFSGGIVLDGYYDFNNTGLFFKCPYPYNSFLGVDWQLNIGNFDLFGPINCFIAGFKHGSQFQFLTEVGLWDFSPIMSGDTPLHNLLFRFFDIILIIFIIIAFSLLRKLLL